MCYIQSLKKLGQCNWAVLSFGHKNSHVTMTDLIDVAVQQVVDGEEGEAVLALAGGEWLTKAEFSHALQLLSDQAKIPDDWCADVWRLVLLSELRASNSNDQEKLDKLQLYYANFHYPEDMAGCSIYSSTIGCPLQCMSDLIDRLNQKITRRPA